MLPVVLLREGKEEEVSVGERETNAESAHVTVYNNNY